MDTLCKMIFEAAKIAFYLYIFESNAVNSFKTQTETIRNIHKKNHPQTTKPVGTQKQGLAA